MSRMIRKWASEGKAHSFWAIYSLRISAWTVPRSSFGFNPCLSATPTYIAVKTDAGALILTELGVGGLGEPQVMATGLPMSWACWLLHPSAEPWSRTNTQPFYPRFFFRPHESCYISPRSSFYQIVQRF